MNKPRRIREIRYTSNLDTGKVSNVEIRVIEEGKEPTEWVGVEAPKSGNTVKIPNISAIDA